MKVRIFSDARFGDIRVSLTEKKEPLFCLSDVCKVLDIRNPSMVKSRLSAKGLINTDTLTKGGVQTMTFINEGNLYKVIFQSRKPEAEQFQDWVFDEVLPSIRKDGGYMAVATDDTPEDIMAKALLIARTALERKEKRILEQEQKINAQNTLMVLQNSVIEKQKEKINEDAPKVIFSDAIVGSRTSCLVGELAKIITQNGYTIGQNKLFEWMRNKGYLGKYGERYNIPNQQYIEMGLFEIKKTVHEENGVLVSKSTTKVTGKGQLYFINKFIGKN